MVPLNYNGDMVIDLAVKFECEVVLVSNYYLGSINHMLLSIEALKNRGLQVKGIIFNGPENKATEEIIMSKTSAPCLLKIPKLDKVNRNTVIEWASKITL